MVGSFLLDGCEAGILFGDFDFTGVDLMRAAGIGGQQGLVGEDVDAPREALGASGDHVDGARRERVGAVVAGGTQAEVDVVADFARLERRQAEVLGDALAQLAHVVGGEPFVEFGLGEEGDLQELGGLRFEVGEQADLLQRFGRHGVRFVDHDDHPLAGGVTLDERVL